jgi:hypothetical protein
MLLQRHVATRRQADAAPLYRHVATKLQRVRIGVEQRRASGDVIRSVLVCEKV